MLNEKSRVVKYSDVKIIYDKLIRQDLNTEFQLFWDSISGNLQRAIIRIQRGEDEVLAKKFAERLHRNEYNRHHKIIIVEPNGSVKFSTFFYDWLERQTVV